MEKMWAFLDGKKTYLLVLASLVHVAYLFLNGDVAAGDALNQALVALGIGTLRAGVAKGPQ